MDRKEHERQPYRMVSTLLKVATIPLPHTHANDTEKRERMKEPENAQSDTRSGGEDVGEGATATCYQ